LFRGRGGDRWYIYPVAITLLAGLVIVVLYSTGALSFIFLQRQFPSTVSGTVYHDSNGNGVLDSGEPVLSGVSINLLREGDSFAVNTTDADGFYYFGGLEEGIYTVEEEDPEAWYSTTPNDVDFIVERGYAQSVFVDFGDKPFNVTITGVVYHDSDLDGELDPGEAGIPGVEVALYDDEEPVEMMVTDPDGLFTFTIFETGLYEVVETDPEGWLSTTESAASFEVESISGEVFEAFFGDTQELRSEITCVVFDDADADGVMDIAETGIPGISVELRDSEGIVASMETDRDGACAFPIDEMGEYLVVEESPSPMWHNTTARETRVIIGSIFGDVVSVEFGETLGASIVGRVFDDANANGTMETDELGLEGVNISLYRDDVFVATDQTDASGNISFQILEPGLYRVNETDPPGWNSTTPGLVNVTIEQLAGQEIEVYFGDKEIEDGGPPDGVEPPDEEPEETMIHGVVYNDANRNGERDPSETGIEGVTVRLYMGESLVDETTTETDGSYKFGDLDPGVYGVEETDLFGWNSITPNFVGVELEAEESVRVDFGDTRPIPPKKKYGDIAGLVYHDLDADGEYDLGEPGLENVIVSLYRGEDFVSSDTTDPDGAFSFPSVLTGGYRVVETDPDGWYSTTPNSVSITVLSKKVSSVAFGDREYSSVWGYAFNDTDGNGDMGEEEHGIPGVNVGAHFGGEVLNATTDEGGYYLFGELNYTGPFNITADLPVGHFRTSPGVVFWDLDEGDDKNVTFGYASDNSSFGVVYGTVFEDLDHNGTRELGEPGIPEVTVRLYNEGYIETTTDRLGSYTIKVNYDGEFDLAEFDRSGYVSTTPNNLTLNLYVGSSGPSPVDFGDFYGTKITGMVFNDINVNGVWDGEPGIDGANVSCSGEKYTTNSSGIFTLYVSGTGIFNLTESDPVGHVSTNAVPGSSNVSKVDANWLSVRIDSPGTTSEENHFGDVRASNVATVRGCVIEDMNVNGVVDPGESPGLYKAWPVVGLNNSVDGNWTTGLWMTLGPGGYFELYALPGDILVTEYDPVGYVSTNVIPASQNAKKIDNNRAILLNAPAGYYENNTVYFLDTKILYASVISGHVFYDDDENGVYNPSNGDFGIPDMNVTIELPIDNETTQEIWALTDTNGSYQFAVLPGTKVRITSTGPISHYPTSPDSVNICPPTPGEYPNINFGYSNDTDVAVITGLVFYDWDNFGEIDIGEGGLAGANVSLTYESVVIDNVTTSSNGLIVGTFSFSVNETGLYGLHEINPAGYRSTTPDDVSIPVNTLGREYVVDFGDTNRTDIAMIFGSVFNDTDSDGVWDPEEPGIPGVNVTIDDGGTNCTTKSYGQFTFGFEITSPGLYTVHEYDLAGWRSTTPDDVSVNVELDNSYEVIFGDTQNVSVSNILGVVYNDANGNGIRDDGESGIPGVNITLDGIARESTDIYGSYTFMTADIGMHTVNETDLPGYFSTTPNERHVYVSELNESYEANFGDVKEPTPDFAVIYGTVFND